MSQTEVPSGSLEAPLGVSDEGEAGDLAARDAASVQRNASLAVSVLTLCARFVGFGRVFVVAAVFGAGFLGDTYTAANQLPTMVFELVAAGALSAVLVPVLVEQLAGADPARADELAGKVLGSALVVMACCAVIGALCAVPLASVLFLRTTDPVERAEKVRLGAFFLRIFFPQLMFYTVALVSTAVLHARRRFLIPAVAPLWNNAVVIAVYVLYGVWFGQTDADSVTDKGALFLGVGTTLGVVALSLPQLWFVRRLGARLRPRLALRDPVVRAVARQGLHAAGYLGLNNLLFMYMVVLSGAGGVVPLSTAWQVFLLPWAIFATPLAVAAFPALSRLATEKDANGFGKEAVRLLGGTFFFSVPVAVGFLFLALPVASLFRLGEMGTEGVERLALYIRSFALAVPFYCIFLGLTRVSYARRDTWGPTAANAVGAVCGAIVMYLGIEIVQGKAGQKALGAGFTVVYVISAFLTARRVLRKQDRSRFARDVLSCVLAGLVMAGVMAAVPGVLGFNVEEGVARALLVSGIAGVLGLGSYLIVTRCLRLGAWELLKRT